jgi:tetratricopeptide (TPR) repeat protein
MAFVYAARDLKNERPVAIKVMRPEIAAALGPERFLREIKIERRLQHGHILPLLDSDAIDELPYYVMPFVTGETLRQRLDRENQLPVEEALQIAGQVAEALDYAHREGVIHRDVKPENILLAGDTVYVADFGIARAAGAAGGEWQSASGTSVWWTSSGVAVGTPGYMSPEQAGAAQQLDGRSDQFSLACVVYEMLAGERPYTGSSIQAIVAKMLSLPAPSVRVLRELVPGVLDKALRRGLAKSPADRFRTCRELVGALSRQPSLGRRLLDYANTRTAVSILAFGAVVTAVVVLQGKSVNGDRSSDVDTTLYVIFPFVYEPGAQPAPGESQRLRDAFTRWRGLNLVNRLRLEQALGRDSVPKTDAKAAELTRGLRAGRYVRISVSPLGDSVSVAAGLYDATSDGGLIRDGTARIGLDRAKADSVFAVLSDRLLFGDIASGSLFDPTGTRGTASFPARQAYTRGQDAVTEWDLAKADSGFSAATRFDPGYAQAFLWLAQVRFWRGNPSAMWQSPAERAAAARDRLASRDQVLSDALVAFERGEVEGACQKWSRLTLLDARDFTAWYGLATCLSSDQAVVRDSRSPTGWAFRSSYYKATKAYQRAFQLLPSIHKALSADSYASVRRILLIDGSTLRFGHALSPDSTTFVAYPSWQGDTLAFLPRKSAEPAEVPRGLSLAVHRERQLFHEIATAWVIAFPQSVQSLEALALSLELLGDATALDTLHRARALVTTVAEREHLAGIEVWMRVKFSAPSDLAGMWAARALADSLLEKVESGLPSTQPVPLASIATLMGRASVAAELTRDQAVVAKWEIPAPIAKTGGPLLVFAALGGPVDSLRRLEQQVDSAIDRSLVAPDQQEERRQWLGRPAAIAFPHYQFKSFEKVRDRGWYLLDMEAAFLRHDSTMVRRTLADLHRMRRSAPVEDLTPDALYPEAWLLQALGDQNAAIEWLDPTLSALSASAPQRLADPGNAGALVQAMVLRADLAESLKDHKTAARWARAVSVLWGNADPFLQPTVRRMLRLDHEVP